MVTLSFAHSHLYGASVAGRTGLGSRPYAYFEIVNPATTARSHRIFGLIDSGCDDCLLDPALLTGLGFATTPSSVNVAGGGTLTADKVIGAEIYIEGNNLANCDLYFGPPTHTHNLLGRNLYLRAFELAFCGRNWHHA